MQPKVKRTKEKMLKRALELWQRVNRMTLMLIVPREDVLLVEAQVQPIDVDQILAGQSAIIRLSSFDQRTTPELAARVVTLSPDLTRD